MKSLLRLLLMALPLAAQAGEFRQSLVIETGVLTESDLIVRNITDLNARKTCMVFYIRTSGTSPTVTCYDVLGQFGGTLAQVGHFKEGNLIIRKVQDSTNNVACVVAYVSTPGTAPAIACYPGNPGFRENIVQVAHLREGDLAVRVIFDSDSAKRCLVAYVETPGTAPAVLCYDARDAGPSGLHQLSYLRQGDLIVRKILDLAGGKSCLVTYVSTEGTKASLFCYDEEKTADPAVAPRP
jgi:hypothetical protein